MKLPAVRFTEMMSHLRAWVYETRLARKFAETKPRNSTPPDLKKWPTKGGHDHYLRVYQATPRYIHAKIKQIAAVVFLNESILTTAVGILEVKNIWRKGRGEHWKILTAVTDHTALDIPRLPAGKVQSRGNFMNE